jgi:hypothetical protein
VRVTGKHARVREGMRTTRRARAPSGVPCKDANSDEPRLREAHAENKQHHRRKYHEAHACLLCMGSWCAWRSRATGCGHLLSSFKNNESQTTQKESGDAFAAASRMTPLPPPPYTCS